MATVLDRPEAALQTRQTLRDRIRSFSETLGPAGWTPLVVLFGLNFVDEFDQVAFGTLSPEIRDAFNLSDGGFILIVTLSGALSILLSVPVGYLADRWHRVRIAQLAGIVWGFASIATGLAPAIGVLIAARFVGGVGRLVNEPVHPSLLSDYYPPPSLPRVFGVHRFANTAGNIAGPVAGALAALFVGASFDNWRPVFVIMALPTFVVLVLSLRLQEPRRGVTIDAKQAERQTDFVGLGEAFRQLRAVQSLKRTWFAAAFFGAGVIPLASFLSLFFDEVYNSGPTFRGGVVLLRGAGTAVGLLIGARLSAKVNSSDRPQLLPIITGLMVLQFAVSMVGMALAPWLWLSTFFAFLLSIGAGGFLPSYLTMVSLIAPPRIRSQAYAYSLLFFALGGIVLSQFAAQTGDLHGLRSGLLLLAVLISVGGFIGVSVKRFVRRDIGEAIKSMQAQEAAESGALLVCKGVDVAYDQVQVLFGVDFDVEQGEIIALLGTNGAGKSTLLKAISGIVDPIGGAIMYEGRDITHLDPVSKSALGIAQVPGGRGIFPGLTVGENIRAAGWLYRKDPSYRDEAVERVLEYFPILRDRWDTTSGSLSGGEQQMLSLAQAFIAKPRLLLIDELSLGLAPTIVEQLLEIVRAIHRNGTTVVLVEQSVNIALKLAGRAMFMEKGEVRFSGPTAELLERPDVLRAVYLKGGAAAHATSAGNGAAERSNPARSKRSATRRRTAILERPVVLSTNGLTKRYGGVTAVDDVDIEVHEGEILGLIGPNGAGKTTIFDLVSGFTPIDSGRVEFMGLDVTEWGPTARAKAGLGRSFQDARLWGALTVKEAIAVACERHIDCRAPIAEMFATPIVEDAETATMEQVEELIGFLGLEAFRDKFVSELSTGSRRIVEIASILAHKPTVLILDEPSSGIAQRETEELGPLLLQIREHLSCSMLVIEHDMPLVTGLADRIIALDQGRTIAEGTPDDVMNDQLVVESYLGAEGYADLMGDGKPKRRSRTKAKRRGKPARA